MTYRGKGAFTCDKCPEDIQTELDDFQEAYEAAQAEGWRAFKLPGQGFQHACPSCVEDFAKERDDG